MQATGESPPPGGCVAQSWGGRQKRGTMRKSQKLRWDRKGLQLLITTSVHNVFIESCFCACHCSLCRRSGRHTQALPSQAYRLPEQTEKCLGYLKFHGKRDHKWVRNLGVVRLEHSSLGHLIGFQFGQGYLDLQDQLEWWTHFSEGSFSIHVTGESLLSMHGRPRFLLT